MLHAYIRLLIKEGVLTPPPEDAHRAPQDNWAHCRECGAEAAHVRELQHEQDCGWQARRAWAVPAPRRSDS